MMQLRDTQTDRLRIGPLSVLTLIAVLSMAVLAVLAISTAHASLTMTQRQADAVTEMYEEETAAQTFLAAFDERLASVRKAGGSAESAVRSIEQSLPDICRTARAAVRNNIEVTTNITGRTATAGFTGPNGRSLEITLTIGDDVTYSIEKWKMAAIKNEEQPKGSLWTGGQ